MTVTVPATLDGMDHEVVLALLRDLDRAAGTGDLPRRDRLAQAAVLRDLARRHPRYRARLYAINRTLRSR